MLYSDVLLGCFTLMPALTLTPNRSLNFYHPTFIYRDFRRYEEFLQYLSLVAPWVGYYDEITGGAHAAASIHPPPSALKPDVLTWLRNEVTTDLSIYDRGKLMHKMQVTVAQACFCTVFNEVLSPSLGKIVEIVKTLGLDKRVALALCIRQRMIENTKHSPSERFF